MNKYLLPLSRKNNAQIAAQIEIWRKRATESEPEKAPPFITFSRQFGCGAFPLAETIALEMMSRNSEELPWAVYDQALVKKIADDHKLSEGIVNSLGKKLRTEIEESVLGLLKHFTPELKIYRSLVATIRTLAVHGRVIIVGRGGAILTRDMPGGLHVRLIAPYDWRVEQTAKRMKSSIDKAKDHVSTMDAEREAYIKKYLGVNVDDPVNYHLLFNNAKMSTEQIVSAVYSALMN